MILFLAYLKCGWEKYGFGVGMQICSELEKNIWLELETGDIYKMKTRLKY